MTIRRITVSQINGNNADNNNTDEIRPYGDMGLYEGDYIDSLDYDRLELLIHDGKRTHLKSKVLSPGIFYGSGADSGDGAGLDTIKLIPDAALHYNNGSYGNDQHIVIDPTVPNHIHIRAGGTIDNSSAVLILGGENNNVTVQDTGYVTVSAKATAHLSNTYGSVTVTASEVSVTAGDDTHGSSTWRFHNQVVGEGTIPARLEFPDGSVQQTAWAGGRVVNPPLSSKGTMGDKAGDIAFNGTYFYYCTNNFVAQQSVETTLSQEATNTNVFYVSTNDVPTDPSGGTIQFNPGAAGPTFNIVSTQLVGLEWQLTTDAGNTSAGLGTPVLITNVTSDIWKRVAWSGDTW